MASATYQELREALARLVAEAEERMPCREGARRVLRQPCAACHCGLRAEADQRGRERAEAEAKPLAMFMDDSCCTRLLRSELQRRPAMTEWACPRCGVAWQPAAMDGGVQFWRPVPVFDVL